MTPAASASARTGTGIGTPWISVDPPASDLAAAWAVRPALAELLAAEVSGALGEPAGDG